VKEQPSGFIERLDLVFYWVADLARAVGFYRDVLGLDLLRQDADSWAEFDAGGRRFALHTVGEGQALPRGGATAVFSVRDLDRAKVALAAHGVASVHDGDVGGYARFSSFLDPDGNEFQLIEYAT
jgi:catechol 2,3-dioxygenase-like lactoylglutathione lyase family enzyme